MTDYLEGEILDHLFLNQAIANIGDASGLPAAATPGNFYIALFTADPGETGSQVNEATFTGYARVAVPRSGVGFSRAGNVISNAATVAFAEATAGSETITHFAVMDASTSGNVLLTSALGTSRLVNAGTTLEFAAGALTATAN
jgi:hypothetical protein